MTILSYEYVYALGRSVGLSKTQATLATAIAVAESGLNPNNIGDQTLAKYGSRGLWQIFTKAHPPSEVIPGSSASTWTPALILKLEDPKINAHAMWLISNHGTNWHPWSTFQHDSHLKFMSKATAAAEKVGDQWSSILNPQTPPTNTPPTPPTSNPTTDPKTMANKPSVSLAKAKAESKQSAAYAAGLCLKHVRTWLGIPASASDATTAWKNAKHKHTDANPPAGAPVFWTGGSSGHGHIALSEGNGKISTTDYPKTGHTGTGVSIHMPKDHWGLHYAGWSSDLNGVDIPGLTDAPTPDPTPGLLKLAPGVKPGKRDAQVKVLQQLLIKAGYGPISGAPTTFYGQHTEDAVNRFHKKNPTLSSGNPYDGAIGPKGFAELQKEAAK